MKKLQHFLKILVVLPVAAMAQSSDEMETDRPSESVSPAIVSKSHLQVELGFTKENDNNNGRRSEEYLYPSATLRYGLTKKLELRMLIEEEADYEKMPDKHKTAGGIEPLKIGLKYNLTDEKGLFPKTSLIARADIPKLASPDFKSDFVAPLFRLAMENSLTKKLSLEYNLGEEWEEDDVHGQFFYSVSPHYNITDKFQVFAEVFGHIFGEKEAENTVDAGILYQLTPCLQFDIYGGAALSKTAPDNFVDLGISFRLPK